MKKVLPLTDTKIRTSKPGEKPITLFDGRGLYLLVTPQGGKYWRWKYRYQGKGKLLSFGTYPDVSLSQAREKRDEARRLLTEGIDPGAHRQAARTAGGKPGNCFEVVALEWFKIKSQGCAPGHAEHIKSYLVRDLFPWIGSRAVDSLTPPDLLAVARRVEERGAIATARRVVGACGEIFRYAIGSGRATSDPTRDLRGCLLKVPPARNRAAVTDPGRIGEILRGFDAYKGGIVVRAALLLAPLVFVRPGELRRAEWKDIALTAQEWRFLATKTATAHIVPLARQAVEILRDLEPITGSGLYVFPGGRTLDRPMSENAILAALRSMGIPKDEMCGHGWRAVARTLLEEKLGFPPVVIEKQLAHQVKDHYGTAYNRTAFLAERREMMQRWADYLDELKATTEQPTRLFRAG
jgi:integrase